MDERAFVATSGRYGRHRTEGPTTIREMTKSVSVQALARLLALPDMYAGMISNGGPTFAGSDAIVADSDHAVLIHCTAGKDRTGVAVPLLLDAVGTDRASVVADYAASHERRSGSGRTACGTRLSVWVFRTCPRSRR